jgi:Fe-S-cluster-containing dehydrogenase component
MAERNESKKPQWAMVIDLDRCTGCEACVVACNVENNVRISGHEEAALGRSINWIRVERYF